MKNSYFLLCIVLLASCQMKEKSARPVHWSYEGENGPTKWGQLAPEYKQCDNGLTQSPIDLTGDSASGTIKWSFNYGSTTFRVAHTEHMDNIIDNGHTIQVSVDQGSSFTLNNKTFDLKQFHFHSPSEHTINGEHAPLESHWVHQSADGALAVVGVLFKEGEHNHNIQQIIEHLPSKKGESLELKDKKIDLEVHLPPSTLAYHYIGSLTTPPCSEDVQWLVLKEPINISKEQLAALRLKLNNNNRPTQALNQRRIEPFKLEEQ